ncbi:MAG TPA: N-acyl homoserine lactonase family protein [Thermomicrobiaceae bacterium]|nr:N-acyl homoserine lactonase family protein [Thermomicrobiaceae bacterium]
MTTPTFAVYAVRYATRGARRGENFYGGDPHDGPMPMDYFVWAAVSDHDTLVVDLGCTRQVAERRDRTYLRSPADGLDALGIDVGAVRHVVLTHLHYDHAGNVPLFPAATFVLQQDEMAFWTGRHAGRPLFRGIVEPEDVAALVSRNFDGRVRFVDGDAEVIPGITVHRVGGHAHGLQAIRVATAGAPVILASDATHFYANLEEDRPFSFVNDLPASYDAFDRLRELAGPSGVIVPGHDPLVMERFPPAGPGLDGVAVRIA